MDLSPGQLRKRPSFQFNNHSHSSDQQRQQQPSSYHYQSSSRYSSPQSTSSLSDIDHSSPSRRAINSLSPPSLHHQQPFMQQQQLMKSLSNESLNNSRHTQHNNNNMIRMSSSSPSSTTSQSPRKLKHKRRKLRRRVTLTSCFCNCIQSIIDCIQRNCRIRVRHNPLPVYKRHNTILLHPILRITLQTTRTILLQILSTLRKVSLCQLCYLLSFITSLIATHIFFIEMPQWEYEQDWLDWEQRMQLSVAELIPPLPSEEVVLQQRGSVEVASLQEELDNEKIEYDAGILMRNGGKNGDGNVVVPLPDYELMASVRGTLAENLHRHAVESCNRHQLSLEEQYRYEQGGQSSRHSLPVMGITVATDSPTNNYLRRLLYTIDFYVVGSIVITWYDEQTESQLSGEEDDRLSHTVILNALEEFIVQKKFVEISRDESSMQRQQQQQSHKVQLADETSMSLMSKIATSIHQYCRYSDDAFHNPSSCQNELIIVRFSTNLGCSSGVNNPLFLHPHAPHWLIVNYDIAYPPGILRAMGNELEKTLATKPDLAVHTFGYIYGRGKIENPWSNFVMTSCAVSKVGTWDENIFPAYYEDDDFRDRIRYIMGEWVDVIGHVDDTDVRNIPHKWMNDTHLIRYQTDRGVAVAHGPLEATTYLSGTHEALKEDEVEKERPVSFFERLFGAEVKPKKNKKKVVKIDPYYYEKERWNIYKEVADGERYFRCKHGALPDPGEHGEDSLRYFGWHERFVQPFVNRTNLTKLKERMGGKLMTDSDRELETFSDDTTSQWALWSFNATRRKCVHEATNKLLAMKPSEERKNATLKMQTLCSVC